MAEIVDYSGTAASNNSASPAGWPEGMAPSGVNNSDRELAARMRRWYADTNGSISAGGTANALTIAANRETTAAAAGEVFAFKATASNTGAATVNITPAGGSARGTVAIQRSGAALKGGEIISGGIYAIAYDGTQYQLVGMERQLSRFLAYNSADDANQTGNGANATVDFDTEITDELGDFATDTYTARYTGLHLLACNVEAYNFGASAADAYLTIVTSNRTYRHIRFGVPVTNTSDGYSMSVIADMDAADTALVRLQVNGMAGNTVTIAGGASPITTFFSGAQLP